MDKAKAGPPIAFWPEKTGLRSYAQAATPAELHAVSLGLEWPWETRSGRPWSWTIRKSLERRQGECISRFIPGCSPPNVWSARHKFTGELVGEVRLDVYDEPQAPGLLWLDVIAYGGTIVYCPTGEAGPGRIIRADTALFDPTLGPEVLREMSRKITDAGPGVFEAVNILSAEDISRALGGVVLIPADYAFDWGMMLFLRLTTVEIPDFPKLNRAVDAAVRVKGRRLI